MIAYYYVIMSVAALVDRHAVGIFRGLSPQVVHVEPSPVIFWTRPGAPLILSGCAQDAAGTVADAVKMCRSRGTVAGILDMVRPLQPVILLQVARPHFTRPVICPRLSWFHFLLFVPLIPPGDRRRIRPV